MPKDLWITFWTAVGGSTGAQVGGPIGAGVGAVVGRFIGRWTWENKEEIFEFLREIGKYGTSAGYYNYQ